MFTHVPYIIFIMRFVEDRRVDPTISLLNSLQGLYNFFVYLNPKIRSAKSSKRNKVTWCQAFRMALLSRGIKSRDELKSKRKSARLLLHQRLRTLFGKRANSRPSNVQSLAAINIGARISLTGHIANYSTGGSKEPIVSDGLLEHKCDDAVSECIDMEFITSNGLHDEGVEYSSCTNIKEPPVELIGGLLFDKVEEVRGRPEGPYSSDCEFSFPISAFKYCQEGKIKWYL